MCKVATIGEQIQAARKDKGMTQETLAEIMNVSRQAVSHWETNRTMPDAETLIRLSKTLEYSFGMISPDQTPVTASEDKQEDATPESPVSSISEASDSDLPDKRSRPFRNKATYCICAAVLILAVLGIFFLIAPAMQRKSASDVQGHTAEYYQQVAENEAGKAYLMINTSVSISHDESGDQWFYSVVFHEMNGCAFSIDRVEHVIFDRTNGNTKQVYGAGDFRACGLETDIPAYGDWRYEGGLPVRDTVTGIGLELMGTDANGEALTFTAYLPLSSK